jgi:hypothetical protein
MPCPSTLPYPILSLPYPLSHVMYLHVAMMFALIPTLHTDIHGQDLQYGKYHSKILSSTYLRSRYSILRLTSQPVSQSASLSAVSQPANKSSNCPLQYIILPSMYVVYVPTASSPVRYWAA